jgi:transcriptional regulator of nitric oxide reductase
MNHQIFRVMAILCLMWTGFFSQAQAGQLDREDVSRQLDGRYTIGEVQPDMRAYPVFIPAEETADGKPKLKAYAFETVDFATTRGYSGKPINLFVVMDLTGRFLVIRLLDHHEPLFISVHTHAKLVSFAAQYVQLSLQHVIDIHGPNDPPVRNEHTASLQGVHRGTISVKAIDRSIIMAAALVALAKLDASIIGSPNNRIVSNGTNAQWSSVEVKADSATGAVAGPAAAAVPLAVTAEKTKVQPDEKTNDADKSSTKKSATDAAEKSSGPEALGNPQAALTAPAAAQSAQNAPQAVSLPASPSAQDLRARIQNLADRQSSEPDWVNVWRSRRVDIAILLVGLAILSAGLIAQKRLSASSKWLRILRSAYLLFTLGFIGWYAQGQLTIVNVTGAIESLSSGGDLSFLMNDPMTVILWLFVGVSLLVWGRGTFCGWLCPFGALQELISLLANAIGLQQRRLRTALDAKLKWIKYGVLATILVSLFAAPSFAQIAMEIEPFKTAISLYFMREWPFVLWALFCLALSVFVYRGYCRYICPLGAALASVNFLQRWSWIPRRDACGTPCQSCRHRCEYQAIAVTGAVNYSECFQCLDCVSIYQDKQRCLPLIQQGKADKRVISIQALERA